MKSSLKPVIISAVVALSAFFAIYHSSCTKDKCKAIACAHGATCDQGFCNCRPGFEGPNCETATKDKFLAQWAVQEQGSQTAPSEYALNIIKTNSDTIVVIQNLWNYFNQNIYANVHGDTLIIPNQQLMGYVVFGKGFIYSTPTYGNNSAIQMNYEVVDTAGGHPLPWIDDFGYYSTIDSSKPSQWIKVQ